MTGYVPPVELILTFDAEYRRLAATGELRKIAPKKLNPAGEAWLPIMSTAREDRKFTILYSNTQKAHDLGKTNDWVVVYWTDAGGEKQCTVVTEFKGALRGKRVIRGREKECETYYGSMQTKKKGRRAPGGRKAK